MEKAKVRSWNDAGVLEEGEEGERCWRRATYEDHSNHGCTCGCGYIEGPKIEFTDCEWGS